jgi:outer membrane protein OmpA-like peptidoglycan-associated protein
VTEEEFAKLEAESELRLRRLKHQVSLRGSTGLLRTHYAGSGPVGTFRFSVLGSYFSTEEFLCPQCDDPDGGPGSTPDEVSRVGAHVQLSATLFDWLEGYFGIHSTATSNTRGDPELLQILGDTTWGAKAFMPYEPDSVFSAGGALEMWMLNGTGAVGIDATSFALRGLTTFDMSNKQNPDEAVPLRFNVGLSYIFDNSGILVRDAENARGRTISRIERYGLNVNRIDRFVPAFGVEGMFEAVRPYFEWSIDVPSNRQDYVCLQNDVHAGDVCLEDLPSFVSTPSRMTIGARIYAFLDGLSFHGALDLGTGGMKPQFWEEMAPESPWNLYFGVAYAADTQPKFQRIKVEQPPPPAPEPEPPPVVRLLEGVVMEVGTDTPVSNAIVRYQGRPMTGMVTDERGVFRTAPLDPGSYSFMITAPDYEDGVCKAVVPVEEAAAATADASASAAGGSADLSASASQPDLAAQPEQQGPIVTRVRCDLKAKPRVGNILATVVDGKTGKPIGEATVTPVTADGRSISLQADEAGSVRFTGVPAGPITVKVASDGYYSTRRNVEVTPREEVVIEIELFKAGRSNFRVGNDSIKLRKPIDFEPGTSNFAPGSRGLVDELAALLNGQPELKVEIQSHTDNSLPFQSALSLTTQRAQKIRELLITAGVDGGRVAATGVGGGQPLVPNTSDRNKSKNNRIEILVR